MIREPVWWVLFSQRFRLSRLAYIYKSVLKNGPVLYGTGPFSVYLFRNGKFCRCCDLTACTIEFLDNPIMSRRQMFPVFLRRNIFTVDSIRLKHYPNGGEIEFLLCRAEYTTGHPGILPGDIPNHRYILPRCGW